MRAVVCNKYGGPEDLRIEEVETPKPVEGEVLVKVQGAALNAADWRLMRGEPFYVRLGSGLFEPKHKIPGGDICGVVEKAGESSRFRVGDQVFGDVSNCGWGGLAEYVSVKEEFLFLKPEKLSVVEAAAVPMAGLSALQGLKLGGIQAGQKILIHGASGGVGTFAVQIAKILGGEVSAVCSSKSLDLVGSLGADVVIDYTKEDIFGMGRSYDLILDNALSKSIFAYLGILNPQGSHVLVGGNKFIRPMFGGALISKFSDKRMVPLMAKSNSEDMGSLGKYIEAGKLKPIVDREYALHEVSEAVNYLESGHPAGKVVVRV